jgi:hypothetical protein
MTQRRSGDWEEMTTHPGVDVIGKRVLIPQSAFVDYSFRLDGVRVRAFNVRGLPVRGGIALFDVDATAQARNCWTGWALKQTIDFVQLTLKEEAWSALLASVRPRSYPRGARPFCYRCMKPYNGFLSCPHCPGVSAESINDLADRLL